jgi:hypothetical protein
MIKEEYILRRMTVIFALAMFIFMVPMFIDLYQETSIRNCEGDFVGVVETFTYSAGGFGSNSASTVKLSNGDTIIVDYMPSKIKSGDSIVQCGDRYKVKK